MWCFCTVVAGPWICPWIMSSVVQTLLNVMTGLCKLVLFWPWYLLRIVIALLKTVLSNMMRLFNVVLIQPCFLLFWFCQKVVLATFGYLALFFRPILWMAKVGGPVVGLLSLVHISLECSERESFRLTVSRCDSDASCLLLVQSRFNCSALW